MERRIFLPVAFALGALAANAQSMGEIRGKVLDEQKQPVPFARITIDLPNGAVGTDADEAGRYVLKPLPTGSYSVAAVAPTFAETTFSGVAVMPDQFTKCDFVLAPKAKELATFRKKSKPDYVHRRPLIDPEQTTRQTLLASEFKNDPNAKNPVKFLSTNFIGVTASRNNEGLHFKGSRTENMASFLDGVRIPGSLPKVPSSAISSVTVYTGGLPAKYGDVTGGVVVIETKTYQELWAQARAAQLRKEFEEQQALEEQDQ
ncbi:MAG: TonB-dependent receptor [Flavobacteriales bacterium]